MEDRKKYLKKYYIEHKQEYSENLKKWRENNKFHARDLNETAYEKSKGLNIQQAIERAEKSLKRAIENQKYWEYRIFTLKKKIKKEDKCENE